MRRAGFRRLNQFFKDVDAIVIGGSAEAVQRRRDAGLRAIGLERLEPGELRLQHRRRRAFE